MVQFEELGIPERALLLKAFDYDVDEEGFILDPTGSRICSDEDPQKYLNVEDAMIVSYIGIDYFENRRTLEVLDGTPTSISKFLRRIKETEDERDMAESERWRTLKRLKFESGMQNKILKNIPLIKMLKALDNPIRHIMVEQMLNSPPASFTYIHGHIRKVLGETSKRVLAYHLDILVQGGVLEKKVVKVQENEYLLYHITPETTSTLRHHGLIERIPKKVEDASY